MLLLLVTLICYTNSFHASWQLDDEPNILENPLIQISDLSFYQIKRSMYARPGSGIIYRPIPCLTLGLNWFFGQKEVFGYHLINFIIHFTTCYLLYLCISQLLKTGVLSGRFTDREIQFIAILAALFWAVNPIQTQAVTYIVQRMASMAAMFSVASIYCYLLARARKTQPARIAYLIFSVFFYFCAILSKENSATLPLILPIIELFFFQTQLNHKSFWQYLPRSLLLGVIVVIAGFVIRPEGIDFIVNYYENRPFTLTERLLTEQRIIVFYLSQLFFPAPWRLSVEHDFVLSSSLLTPWTTVFAILINLMLIVGAFLFKNRQPLFSFAILFFYTGHLVESTFVPLELVFEHRNYLPSLFLFVPVAQLILFLLKTVAHHRPIYYALIGTTIIIVIFFGYSTYERNKAWQTKESLWLDAAAKAPHSARPLAALALMLAWGENQSHDKDLIAKQLIEKSISLKMSRRRLDAAQYGNLGSLHHKMGDYQLAVEYFQQGLKIAPEDAKIHFSLAKTYICLGLFGKARSEIETIFNLGFIHADYLNLLGFIDLWAGRPDLALRSIQEAHKYAKDKPSILLNMGKTLSLLGFHQRAEWFLNQALHKGGEDLIVLLCLLENAWRNKDINQATEFARRIISSYPLMHILSKLTNSDERYQTVPLASEEIKVILNTVLAETLH
ncbi:MAG: tetratricopeptide repeat protein [Desulfobulbaceae bacterium]|nr:tetratricopeptide repeat protein [Desulfobulbaceae bacterium]